MPLLPTNMPDPWAEQMRQRQELGNFNRNELYKNTRLMQGLTRPNPPDVRAGGRGGGGGGISRGIFNPYGQQQQQNVAPPQDDIMTRYRKMAESPDLQWQNYSPERTSYQESPEAQSSLNQLSELARTGGLSEANRADIRARGVSPIRAAYSSANRNLSRQRALQGGYAPGFATAASRMAREQGELMSGATRNVEADIAERVQAGRLSAAPQYENATRARSESMNEIARQNADRATRAEEFNRSGRLQYAGQNQNRLAEALRGMTSRQGQQNDETQALINAYLRSIGR